jgi:hypothetical protein
LALHVDVLKRDQYAASVVTPTQPDNELKTLARVAGAWYLALAVTGAIGFLTLRPALHVSSDAAATLRNLVEKNVLAHLCVAFELAIVLTQALAAISFYRLFRSLNAVAAGALAAFGLVNAIVILASAACVATAVSLPGNPSLAPGGDVAATAQLLFELSLRFWDAGAVFFGLWLIPMGYVVTSTGVMPINLGRILIAGGVGYVLGAFLPHRSSVMPHWIIDVMTVPASIGEFWMIGYLLFVGVRRVSPAAAGPLPIPGAA